MTSRMSMGSERVCRRSIKFLRVEPPPDMRIAVESGLAVVGNEGVMDFKFVFERGCGSIGVDLRPACNWVWHSICVPLVAVVFGRHPDSRFHPMNRLPPEENQDSYSPQLELSGLLLVAAPHVEHELFGRSVCLILEHEAEHSIGVLLNRPFALDVQPLWEQLTKGIAKTAEPPRYLNFGGPRSGPVVAIHDREMLAEGSNGNGIYMAAQVDTLKKLTMVSPDHYRLLVGHAAWKPGQLESEIATGDWYVLPASPDLVFLDDYDMWKVGMRRVGDLMMRSFLDLTGLPATTRLELS